MAFSTDTEFLTWPFLFLSPPLALQMNLWGKQARHCSSHGSCGGGGSGKSCGFLKFPWMQGAWRPYPSSSPRHSLHLKQLWDVFFTETAHKPWGIRHGCHLPEEKGLLCLEAMDTWAGLWELWHWIQSGAQPAAAIIYRTLEAIPASLFNQHLLKETMRQVLY